MVSLLGSVVMFAALAATIGAPAGADEVGVARGQIAAVEAEMAAAAGRVHALTDAFGQAEVTAATGAQQLVADQATLAAARRHLDGSLQVLREDALQSYTGGAAAPVAATPAMALDPEVSSAYISVAVGDLSDSIDQYQLEQRRLQAAVATVSAQEQTDHRALAQAGAARAAALSEAAAAEGRLAGLQDRLVSLEAQQTAVAAAAAPTAQGGPLRGGLVAVVRAIVQAPASAPTTTIPAPAHATPATAAPSAPPTSAPSGSGPSGSSPTSAPPTSAPPTSVPAVPPTTVGPPPTPPSGGVWLELRTCESSDDYRADTGNGFYGAYQFSQATWSGLGLPGRPDQEPAAMQDQAARELQARSGWGNWPACAAALGLG